MEVHFSLFSEDDIPAVNRFNQRFLDAGSDLLFFEKYIRRVYRKDENTKLYYEFYLAKDEQGEVHGGYYFKNQEFCINQKPEEIVFMQLPISEGVIDSNYKAMGRMIFEDMEKRRNLVFVLGMGGFQYPLPHRLMKLGYQMYLVPFYFYITKPRAFLNDFEYINTLKKFLLKKIAINIVKIFGLLYLIKGLISIYTSTYRLIKSGKYKGVNSEIVEEFSDFADGLWQQNKDFYSIVAQRDQHLLNQIYPKTSPQFHRLKISKNGVCIGWVVMLCTQMSNDKYFGNLKLGTLIDAFSSPHDAELLIHEAVKHLKKQNAGLIVVNHTDVRWGKHFQKNGFLKGPSNFIFGMSKRIKEYYPGKIDFENSFLMRGDGDGPIGL